MRHWMAWLRPVIVESDTAFISDFRPPGLFHAIDAAAVWLALAKRLPAPLLTAPSTAAVGSGAAEHAADKAPPWDEEWAEALRRRSLAILGAAMRSPCSQEALLAEINQTRAAARRTGVPPLGGDDLRTLAAMLRTAPEWRAVRRSPGHLSSSDVLKFLEQALQSSRTDPEDLLLLGLAHLHEHQDWHFAEVLHGLYPSEMVEAAALAHLAMAVRRLRLAIDQHLLGLRLGPSKEWACDPSALLNRVLGWYDRLSALSVFADRQIAKEVQLLILELGNAVERDLDPALLQQLTRASVRTVPLRTLRGLRFTLTFGSEMSKRQRGRPRAAWCQKVGAQLARLFNAALDTPSPTALDLVSEIFDLADAAGHPIAISVLDTRLLASVQDTLLRHDPLSGAKLRLVKRTVDASLAEQRRLKWWVSDDVRSLIEAAARFNSARSEVALPPALAHN